MLDPKLLRTNPEEIRAKIQKKGVNPEIVDMFLAADEEWRAALQEVESLRHRQKEAGAAGNREEAGKLKKELQQKEARQRELAQQRIELLEQLPNLPFDDVPEGKDEAGNVVLREVGERPSFSFPPRDSLTLGEKLGIIDVRKAAEVAGSRFGYLKGGAALLEFALVQFAMRTLVAEGFVPVVPPAMIRPEVFRGMGRLTKQDSEERYYLPKDNLYLIGSAEHTLGPLHMNETIPAHNLPIRYVGFSSCFRREAGSYGRDTRGILRVHQFDKVEMFSFTLPEKSEEEHRFLLSLQEKMMQALKLPYRVVEICTGDMGWTDARQFDIEVWLPSENRYRETHSCSNTTDFQARGIQVRYRDAQGASSFVHMLNATGFAIGRTVIAILENFQREDGSVEVPEVLREYVGTEKLVPPKGR